jgi:hypothetical protein
MACGSIMKWLREQKAKEGLAKMLQAQPEGARMLTLFEGEQVTAAFQQQHEHILAASLHHQWRPLGEALPEGVEPIPGYARPWNWRELERQAEKQESRFEVSNGN